MRGTFLCASQENGNETLVQGGKTKDDHQLRARISNSLRYSGLAFGLLNQGSNPSNTILAHQ